MEKLRYKDLTETTKFCGKRETTKNSTFYKKVIINKKRKPTKSTHNQSQ